MFFFGMTFEYSEPTEISYLSQLYSKCSKWLPNYKIYKRVWERPKNWFLNHLTIFFQAVPQQMGTKIVPFSPFIVVLERKHFLNIESFTAGVALGIFFHLCFLSLAAA
jgi:hypothetical protein